MVSSGNIVKKEFVRDGRDYESLLRIVFSEVIQIVNNSLHGEGLYSLAHCEID